MSIRARFVVLATLPLVLAACPKNTAPSVPSWDEGGGGDENVMAAHDPAPSDTADAAAEPATAEATTAEPTTQGPEATPATTQATTEIASVEVATGTEPTPAPPAVEPGKTPAELPKAKHTKIDASCGKDPGVGQKLKGYELKTVDGKPASSKSLRGKVVLVNFWGTWCKPCLKELPEFDQLFRRYRKHGLSLVAIATDEDPQPVKEFVDARKISAKVLIGAEDYAGEYGSSKFPFSFVVDDKGVIRASYRGYRPECMGKLEADVRKQLEARASQ